MSPVSFELDDVDALCEAASAPTAEPDPYEISMHQMSAGTARSKFWSVDFAWGEICAAGDTRPLLQPSQEHYGPRIELRGSAPRTSTGMVIPLGPEPFLAMGRSIGRSEILVVRPREELEIVSPPGTTFVAVHFDARVVEGLGRAAGRRFGAEGMIRPRPEARVELARAIGAWLAAPDPHGFVGDRRASEVSTRLLDAALGVLLSAEPTLPRRGVRPGRRAEIARCVRDYMDANLDRALSRGELCAVADTPARSLEMAFRERYGAPPIAYHRWLRLNRARAMLKESDQGAATVSRIALRCGFEHFGRFSVAYRQCFGESPSTTLARGRPEGGRSTLPAIASGGFASTC